jgi:hypothetical protein
MAGNIASISFSFLTREAKETLRFSRQVRGKETENLVKGSMGRSPGRAPIDGIFFCSSRT